MDNNFNFITANVWVYCKRCGDKHRLIPSLDTPVYWCGGQLYVFQEDDEVDIEELEGEIELD